MAYSALTSPSLPLLLAASSVAGLSVAAWLLRLPGLAVSVLIVSLVAGQLFRLPLPGQGGGLLISDVATVLVIFAALLQWLKHPQKIGHWSLGFGIFLLWSLLTLVIRVPELGASNSLIAALYWLRLSATLALLPALLILFQDSALRRLARQLLFGAITVIVALGFLQLILFPDLRSLPAVALREGGWDPHQGRLFSTWLDPNLFGGFLIVVLPWLIFITIERVVAAGAPRQSHGRLGDARLVGVKLPTGPAILAAITLVALLFTQSRSSAAALFGTILLLSPFMTWQLRRLPRLARLGTFLSAALGIIVLVSLGIFLAPHRLAGLLTIDDTTALRAASLTSAWKLIEHHPWLGVGYNAYQFAATDSAGANDFTIHSRAGTDSSFLTLWATTGLVGLVLFLAFVMAILLSLLKRSLRGDLAALAAAVSLVALALHAQFVNSFLYSHLLITLILLLALCFSTNISSSSRPPSSLPI